MTGTLLAIDPGNTQSGYVLVDADCRPLDFGKVSNGDLANLIEWDLGKTPTAVIEMVASYGMPVGAEVFETCVWIGRFVERLRMCRFDRRDPGLVYRRDVKLHLCGTARANDANIRQALVDRFAKGVPNHGKGAKSSPGWFYGFRADVWQAYALAVYAMDQRGGTADASRPASPLSAQKQTGVSLGVGDVSDALRRSGGDAA